MIVNRIINLSVNLDQLLMSAWGAILRVLKLISDSVGENAVITK